MKKFIIASLLAAASVASFAAKVDVTTGTTNYTALSDTSFKAALAAGTYSFSVSLVALPNSKNPAGNNTTLNSAWLSYEGDKLLNGASDFLVLFDQTGSPIKSFASSGTFTVATLGTNATRNVFLNVEANFGKKDGYELVYTITPVPEPETYAMFAAGLAALGLMSRRRKQA